MGTAQHCSRDFVSSCHCKACHSGSITGSVSNSRTLWLVSCCFRNTARAEQEGFRMQIGDVLFGCGHKRTSFPRTIRSKRDRSKNNHTGTYVVCLDCGKEFGYDWKEMRLLGPLLGMKQRRFWPAAKAKLKMPIVSLILSLTGLTEEEKRAA